MKRVVSDHRALFLIVGTLLAVTGVAWGAGSNSPARPIRTAAKAKASVTQVATARVPAQTQLASRGKVSARTHRAAAPSTLYGAQGMKIYRTPLGNEVGQPDRAVVTPNRVDSPAEIAALKPVRMANGSLMVDLQGHFQESMVMKLDANGKRITTCVPEDKVNQALAPAKSAAQAPASAPATKGEDK